MALAEFDANDEALVHPRIAGALVDYAAAVIHNNRAMMNYRPSSEEKDLGLRGSPAVGLAAGGKLTTAHGVTITELTIDEKLRKAMA